MPVHDPVPPANGDGQPGPHDRFRPAPLTPIALAGLQQALACRARRRRAYRAGPLRVCVDGAELCQVDPKVGVGEPCRVPCSASSVEIVGDDAEGALLLAVVPLPTLEALEAEGAHHLSVTLEGGQTVALTIALGERSAGEAPMYVIQLACTAAAPVPAILLRSRPETLRQPQEGG